MKQSNSNNSDTHTKIMEQLYKNEKDDKYWSIKDISAYINKSESTVRRKLITDPRFPKSFSFGGKSSKRWLASEVKKALLSFHE